MAHSQPEPQDKIEPGTTDEIVGRSKAERPQPPEALIPDGTPASAPNDDKEWRPSDAAEEPPASF